MYICVYIYKIWGFDPMFINDRRIWGLTLMTRILFRGWNLPDYTKIFGVSAGGRRCFRARDATVYPVALLGMAGNSTIFFHFWIAFNRNILLYKWEICHGQVWLRQLVNVCVDIAPTCFQSIQPSPRAQNIHQLSLGEVNLPLASWI